LTTGQEGGKERFLKGGKETSHFILPLWRTDLMEKGEFVAPEKNGNCPLD